MPCSAVAIMNPRVKPHWPVIWRVARVQLQVQLRAVTPSLSADGCSCSPDCLLASFGSGPRQGCEPGSETSVCRSVRFQAEKWTLAMHPPFGVGHNQKIRAAHWRPRRSICFRCTVSCLHCFLELGLEADALYRNFWPKESRCQEY